MGGRVAGLALEDGPEYACSALVITTGTFLNGLIHVGREQKPAGRVGEPPTRDLAESLKSFGFTWGRLKTGTPPRLARRSIDFDAAVAGGLFHVEHGDAAPWRSPTRQQWPPRIESPATSSTRRTPVHQLVRASIDESPLFNGQIAGIGPRYCPSLEDKVVRFPERDRHQLFLEPEGRGCRRNLPQWLFHESPRGGASSPGAHAAGARERAAASARLRC